MKQQGQRTDHRSDRLTGLSIVVHGKVGESLSWLASRCQAGSQLTVTMIVLSHLPDLSSIFHRLLMLVPVLPLALSAQKTQR